MEKFSQLITELLAALGFPPSHILAAEDAVRALLSASALFDLALAQSNQNHNVAKTGEFYFATREKALPAVKGVPLWIERRDGTAPNEAWHFIPAVNLAAVEDAAERGDERCAFFTEGGQLKVRLSYLPGASAAFRLRYDPDPTVGVTLDDPLKLPAAFYPMLVAHGILNCLPVMMINAGGGGAEPPSDLALAGWDAARANAVRLVEEYRPRWRQHCLGSRGGARGRDRRPVL